MKEITLFQIIDIYKKNFLPFVLISLIFISIFYYLFFQFYKDRNIFNYKTTYIIPLSVQLKIDKLNDAIAMLYDEKYFNRILKQAKIIYDENSHDNTEISYINNNIENSLKIINNYFFEQEISNLFKDRLNLKNITFNILSDRVNQSPFEFQLSYKSNENFETKKLDKKFDIVLNNYNSAINESIINVIDEAVDYYQRKKIVTLKNLESISKLYTQSYTNFVEQKIIYLENELNIARNFKIEEPIVLDKEIIVNLNKDIKLNSEIDFTYGYKIIEQQIDYLSDHLNNINNEKSYFNNKLLSDYVKSDFILNDFNAELNLLNIYSDQKYNIFQSRNSEKIVNKNGILIVFSSTLLLWLFTNFVIVVIYFFYNNYKQNLKLND